METWATFSIVDHRQPIYRQALALFDRIVVPLPNKTIGNQTEEELVQLNAEVLWLQGEGAAVPFEWKSSEFEAWRRPFLAEAVSAGINRDIFDDTRLNLAEKFTSKDVQAIPVYGSKPERDKSRDELMKAEEVLTIEVMQRLPVPEWDTPFQSLINLRKEPAFRTALNDLLEWKRQKAPEIVLAKDRASAVAKAMGDFDKLTKKYAQAMEAHGHKKEMTVGSIFFSIFRGELLGAVKEGVVSFREVREPSWKKVSEMKCAPGGVVYHFGEAMGITA